MTSDLTLCTKKIWKGGHDAMIHFKKAKVEQTNVLTDLALRSQTVWYGDEGDFFDKVREHVAIPMSRVEYSLVYTMSDDDVVIGFFSLVFEEDNGCLKDFYVDPRYIGKGFGKKMWFYMLEVATNHFLMDIEFVSEPLAEGFFQKMGSVKIGEKVSHTMDNHKLPIMCYYI